MWTIRRAVLWLAAFFMLFAGLSVEAQENASATDADTQTTLPAPPSPEDVNIDIEDLNILLVPMTQEELADLASVWQGHLKSLLERTSELNLSLRQLDDAASEPVRNEIAVQTEARDAIRDKYSAVLEAWQSKGASPEDIEPHRTYITALAVAAVRTTDAKTLLVLAGNWATSWDGGLGLLLRIFALLIAIWVLMFVARILRRSTLKGLQRLPNVSRLLQSFISLAVYWATFVVGILTVLGVFGVNVTPLFAIFGGLSFILGFALQETLGNLASGLMIMVLKPFDTGDYIQIGSASGFVDEMSVVSTKIRTFDNQIIVVPNSKIWGDVITNVSASAERRVDLVFGIGYSDNAQHAISVLGKLVEAHPMCIAAPPPEIFVGELGDNSVNIFCRPWCKSDDYWTVYWDLTGQAKEAFDAEGISIPFPQRDVHLIQEAAT